MSSGRPRSVPLEGRNSCSALLGPPRIRFTAGQFVNVEVPGTGDVRAFSMANPPSADSEIEAIARRMGSLTGYGAYLCGPPPMVAAARELVIRLGVREANVYYDAFVPTGQAAALTDRSGIS
jgi:NAD(P)H-flavin reductase